MTTVYTKESLIQALCQIRDRGWISVPAIRQVNDGNVGNVLEDLLDIQENNLPMPNASEWELKCHRLSSNSLLTLLHFEPSPRALKLVPSLLLTKYGWRHDEAGRKYPVDEMSFRQTINAASTSDRGFTIVVDREKRKILVSFDASYVDPRHSEWLDQVRAKVGLGELNPQPYWGFDDLRNKMGTKLLNCFYVGAETKKEGGQYFFRYSKIQLLEGFQFEGLLTGLEQGFVFVDFDARTGHNHGTKFRVRQNSIPQLYNSVIEL